MLLSFHEVIEGQYHLVTIETITFRVRYSGDFIIIILQIPFHKVLVHSQLSEKILSRQQVCQFSLIRFRHILHISFRFFVFMG